MAFLSKNVGQGHVGRAAYPAVLRRIAVLHLLPCLLYTLLGVIVTWPLAAHFNTAVVGAEQAVDAYLHVWNTWWVATALRDGTSPFFTNLLYYPYGADLFWQTLGFSQGVIATPVTLAFGPIAGFNFVTISAFPIGGYAAYLLAKRVVDNAPAALVAGAIYAFSSYHMDKLIAGNVVASVQWVPWYVLALYIYFERPRWYLGVLCGLLLLWVTFGSWYYGMFGVLFTGFMTLVWMFESGRKRAIMTAVWGSIPVLVWLLILAPRILSLSEAGDSLLWDLRDLQLLRSADIVDFFLPNPLHPWWGASIRAFRATMHEDIGIWDVSLGWVGIVLAAIGMAKYWKVSRRWLLLTLMSMIFAMGAVMQVAGVNTGIPLPWALVENLPGIRANHRPNHFVVMSIVTFGVLAAFGVRFLITRFSFNRTRAWLFALVLSIGVVFIDGYAGPLTVVHRDIHPFYATLPAPDGALLPLPLLLNINRSDNLVPQIVHGYPILGGYMARPPRYTFAQYTPGIHELEQGRVEPNDILSPGWPEIGRHGASSLPHSLYHTRPDDRARSWTAWTRQSRIFCAGAPDLATIGYWAAACVGC